jgi:hypothetical protein
MKAFTLLPWGDPAAMNLKNAVRTTDSTDSTDSTDRKKPPESLLKLE